jgi:hypothetical protein
MHDGGGGGGGDGGGGFSGGHSGGHSSGGHSSGGHSSGGHSSGGHSSGHFAPGHSGGRHGSSGAGRLGQSGQFDPESRSMDTANPAPRGQRGQATVAARGFVRMVLGIIIIVFAIYVIMSIARGQ